MQAPAAEQKLLFCNTVENFSLFFKSDFEDEVFWVCFFFTSKLYLNQKYYHLIKHHVENKAKLKKWTMTASCKGLRKPWR